MALATISRKAHGSANFIGEYLAMVLQAYIDDSADDEWFVLGGFIATTEAWEAFAAEWEPLIQPFGTLQPNGRYEFKMTDMAALPERMERVVCFYRVIEKYLPVAISVSFLKRDLDSAIDRIGQTHHNFNSWRNPFSFAYRAITDAINLQRLNAPWINSVEVVNFHFDQTGESGKVTGGWPHLLAHTRPEHTRLYGNVPQFHDSQNVVALQAADFWAWWVRIWARNNGAKYLHSCSFAWAHELQKPQRFGLYFDEDSIIQTFVRLIALLYPEHEPLYVAPKF